MKTAVLRVGKAGELDETYAMPHIFSLRLARLFARCNPTTGKSALLSDKNFSLGSYTAGLLLVVNTSEQILTKPHKENIKRQLRRNITTPARKFTFPTTQAPKYACCHSCVFQVSNNHESTLYQAVGTRTPRGWARWFLVKKYEIGKRSKRHTYVVNFSIR